MGNKEKYKYAPDYAIPPGATLAELLDSIGMTQRELAVRSGRPVKTINEIVKGKASITSQTALRLERILGMPASFWNNLERNYQDALARIAEQQQLHQQLDWLDQIPVKKMIEWGWISTFDNRVDQMRELLNYFGIASPKQWPEILAEKQVAYRQSKVFKSHPVAVATWLRKGDLESQKIKCEPYSKANLLRRLKAIRNLTTEEDPDVFIPKMTRLAASSGVAVVFVRELPGVRISGAARWLSSTKALIQLTLRYKTNDHLWFSLFHEFGHIFLDKKKEPFLDKDFMDKDDKEEPANRFARNQLIPPPDYADFCQKGNFSQTAVKMFASRINIAPGIVVGRLQYDKLIPYRSHLNKLKARYQWAS